ncbi:MFS transporter [Pseudomonas panipatensis]|uniref:Predicted arabinose efflux permease, MFS family n=1 Tax=Pseudomonas panipatensis TaxID=428992 RepID=A0A1G8GAZ2_9PSED|nr:MFS transporter [Pseudomonas panipatensis]SDH91569.1 Predicted arabinose efflux permease, MFS family [Pseudomonas panipatensis]SMP44477.1 Predicted arabinose efflux permease, MFS family [Pseudomonas panipatensis]
MPASRPWPTSIRALRHRNFRLYFCGYAISTLGTWIQQVALAWLVYRLSGSAALLGVTSCVALLPQLLIGPLAGAWIDRHDKRRLLLISQSLLAAQAAGLAVLTHNGLIGPGLIVAMSALLGVLNALDTPLRQSLLSRFVDQREDLPNALALNASLFTCSRFVGPPLAGLLLGVTSESLCFAINACSYLALVIGLLCVRLAPAPRAAGSMRHVFREGLNYALETPNVRRMMLSVLLVNLTASSYAALLPVFARDIFAGDARTLGWLWGAAGLGSLLSTLFLATLTNPARLPKAILASAVACAVALLLFAGSRNLPLSLAAMALLGFGVSICNVGTNIVLQSQAPERLRGRVVSLYTSTRFGFDAIGGLLAGVLAAHFGGPWAMGLAGALLLTYCVWLSQRPAMPVEEQAA